MNSLITDYFLCEGLLAPSNAVVALIVLDDGRYLGQLRSQRAGIFYPDHWGLFGGAVEDGESPEAALVREIKEELELVVCESVYFTEFIFDFNFRGIGRVWRRYYEIHLDKDKLPGLHLGEGVRMQVYTAKEFLSQKRVVPYDAFAIWLHATQKK